MNPITFLIIHYFSLLSHAAMSILTLLTFLKSSSPEKTMKPSVKQTSSSPSHCRYQQRLPEESDMRTFSRGAKGGIQRDIEHDNQPGEKHIYTRY